MAFCPLMQAECLQDKCEFSYHCNGEHKWCCLSDLWRIAESLKELEAHQRYWVAKDNR